MLRLEDGALLFDFFATFGGCLVLFPPIVFYRNVFRKQICLFCICQTLPKLDPFKDNQEENFSPESRYPILSSI